MLLNKVKMALRINNSAFDEDINDLIDTCILDLKIAGINIPNEQSEEYAMIIQAVKTYCRAYFGLENSESEKYQRSYESIKLHMSLVAEFRSESDV